MYFIELNLKKEKFAFGWQGGKFEFLAQFEWELASRSDAFSDWHRFYIEVRTEFKKRF